ncbi:MAG: NAD(P)/FAD-dependent oxidoreductase [Coleofasciculaceae cyanobacterium SM2_3_26]|nr:NAD(P)/FAD-dependent oxidoreductase [Coleofasciculaceae cyanobacterium SM2_3_26]
MSESPQRICILGGGFGGLYTALRLSEFSWSQPQPPEIVLVDQSDRFVFLPLLYELMTEELQTWEIAPPFVELLANTPVKFHQGKVANIDTYNRQVRLQEGETLSYDRLLLALGGETPLDIVPGAEQYAFPFKSIADAYRLEEKLRSLETSDTDPIRIVIVGGGYSGVELACKLADRLKRRARLRLVDRNEDILQSSTEFNRKASRKALSDRGIWLDLETNVQLVEAGSISLEYRGKVDAIPTDVVVWTVGTRVLPVVKSLPLKQNQRGQLVTDVYLRVEGTSDIFALGDLAECRDASGQQVPNTAQAAFQQADYAAWNLRASLSDRAMLPFQYQHLGEMMTLGIENATLTSLGMSMDGAIAHLARRLIYLYRFPTLDHQIKVGLNWIAQPLREFLFDT